MNTLIIWGIVAAIFLAVELATVALVSVWFFIAAIAAGLTAVFGGPFWLQVTVFVVVSILAMATIYPWVSKMVNDRKEATNADRALGKTGVVAERIDNIMGTGRVLIDGRPWTARSIYGEEIDEGVRIRVVKIDGVKLLVKEM